MARKSWDEYFMSIAEAVAERATCDRGKTGCIIVKDNRILSTGYVGSVRGGPHCDDVGHQFKKTYHEDSSITNHCVRTVHAEQNAICQASQYGIPIKGATFYCKLEPCFVCAKMLINAGIKRVVAQKAYHSSQDSREIFKQAGVKLEILDKEVEQYENQ